MRAKPLRIRPTRNLALTMVTGLTAGAILLASGPTALAQTPSPSPPPTSAPQEPTTTPPPLTVAPPAQPLTPVPPAAVTYQVTRGDTLWSIARKSLGSGMLWPAIYAANASTVERAARTYGHTSSRRGDLIFPGTRLQVGPGKRLIRGLTAQQQQLATCLGSVVEAYGELRAKNAGQALQKAGPTELSRLLADPTVIEALTKPVGALKACGPLVRKAQGLAALAREALNSHPELKQVLGQFIGKVKGLACLASIAGGAALREPGINVPTGSAVKDVLQKCPELLQNAGAVHNALKALGIPTMAELGAALPSSG
ncbi:LysM peptidoglycan-binding domain-containing protein [Streptomyces sp. NPDC004561]